MTCILIIAALPAGRSRLRIDEEVRTIRERLRSSRRASEYQIHYFGAARATDVTQALRQVNPQIVHFAGFHSARLGGPVLEDQQGNAHELSTDWFADLFKRNDVDLLLLNTCEIGIHAEAFGRHVRYVIGMIGIALDEEALLFAREFYASLGDGLPIDDAFGIAAHAMANLRGPGVTGPRPVLYVNPRRDGREASAFQPLPDIKEAPSKRVLVLSAVPKNFSWLNVDVEVRDIRDALQGSRQGKSFSVVHCPAVRKRDITTELRASRPDFLHFIGHGTSDGKLVVDDEDGRGGEALSPSSLASLLRPRNARIDCIFLNAAYSSQTAELIAAQGTSSIGYRGGSVGDEAAITFAREFYAALGDGEAIEAAFEYGLRAAELDPTAVALCTASVRQWSAPVASVAAPGSPRPGTANSTDSDPALSQVPARPTPGVTYVALPKCPLLFVNCVPEDTALLNEFVTCLDPLRAHGVLTIWDASQIRAGEVRQTTIGQRLEDAHLVVPLISSAAMASDDWNAINQRALARRSAGVQVIPVLIRHALLDGSPLAALECLPAGGRPVSAAADRGEVWVTIAKILAKMLRT